MTGTVMRALGIFAISALLLGQGLLILWVSLGGWMVTMPGILAVLAGAGLWGLIAVEGLLGQLRPAEGSEIVPSWAPLLTFAAAIGAFYLAGGFGELGHPSVWPWLVGWGAVWDGGPCHRHSPLAREGLITTSSSSGSG